MSKGYLPTEDAPANAAVNPETSGNEAAEQAAPENAEPAFAKAGRAAEAGELDGAALAEAVPALTKAGQDLPLTEDLRAAYEKVSYTERLRSSIVSTTNTLIVVAAVAVLVAMLFMPVLRIYGDSMNATLSSGDLVVSVKGAKFETGDVIAFYYNNNVLVKRVIANSGDWVDIDLDGNVYVNQHKIEEPYLAEKAYGEPDIDFPYQVPEDRVFVLGDNRSVSVDSRNNAIGCITSEQIVGKIVFRIWPLNRIGPVH